MSNRSWPVTAGRIGNARVKVVQFDAESLATL